jgi:hypothetical protein
MTTTNQTYPIWQVNLCNHQTWEDYDNSPIGYFATEAEAKEFCDKYAARQIAYRVAKEQVAGECYENDFLTSSVSYHAYYPNTAHSLVDELLFEHTQYYPSSVDGVLLEDYVIDADRAADDKIFNKWYSPYEGHESYHNCTTGEQYWVDIIEASKLYYVAHKPVGGDWVILGKEFPDMATAQVFVNGLIDWVTSNEEEHENDNIHTED